MRGPGGKRVIIWALTDPELLQQLKRIFSTPSLFCTALDPANDQAHFLEVQEDELRQTMFHDLDELLYRVAGRGSPRELVLSLEGLVGLAEGLPVPTGMLHYVVFTPYSCSTLIMKGLGELAHCVALREPSILQTLTRAKRHTSLARAEPERWRRIVRTAVLLLSRRFFQEQVCVTKSSDDATSLLGELLTATPACKSLFLYSDFPSFFAHAYNSPGRRDRTSARLQGMLLDKPELKRLAPELRDGNWSAPQATAAQWFLLMTGYHETTGAFPGHESLLLDCDDFLESPASGISKLAAFFGIPTDGQEISKLESSGLFSTSAKSPGESFDREMRKAKISDALMTFASEFDEARAWLHTLLQTCPNAPAVLNYRNAGIDIRKRGASSV
jgi:hypothetical protein